MDPKNFFPGREAEAREVSPGVFRKILAHGDTMMVCELSFEEGAVGPLHTHPHSQCTYILSGAFAFEVNGQKQVLVAGDSAFKQPGIPHGAVCLKAGRLLDVFSPMREDFLA